MTKQIKLSSKQKEVVRLGPLVHFGANIYQPKKVRPIENDWVKPKGGLWTSPDSSKWGWKDWCKSEEFSECAPVNSFKVLLNPGSSVFIIDGLADLLNTPMIEKHERKYIDFELLAKSYDAIWLTEKGQQDTRLSYPVNLYGWDCESVLIMNPYSVTPLPRPAIKN